MTDVASVNWLPPENLNKTSVDYYEVIYMSNGSDNNLSTTFRVPASASLLEYKSTLPNRNYSTVSVTAVDVCGQRSELSKIQLNVTSGGDPSHNDHVNRLSAGTIIAVVVINSLIY